MANNCCQDSNNCCLFAKYCYLLLVFATTVFAQEFNMNSMPPPGMQMEYSAGALKDGGTLTVTVTVPDKWHVNANKVTDEFLKPSSVEAKAEGLEFGEAVWPEPIKEYNEALELEIWTFRGTFSVQIPVKAVDGTNYDSLGTTVTFNYQACDNSICLAPASKTISLDGSLNGGAVGAGVKKNDSEIGAVEGRTGESRADTKENHAGSGTGPPNLIAYGAVRR